MTSSRRRRRRSARCTTAWTPCSRRSTWTRPAGRTSTNRRALWESSARRARRRSARSRSPGQTARPSPPGRFITRPRRLAFYLESAVTVRAGTGEGTLIASETGDAYNIAAGEIVTALRNYGGVSGFANQAADGGADPETDEALLARYLERMRKPATSGNPWHYQR